MQAHQAQQLSQRCRAPVSGLAHRVAPPHSSNRGHARLPAAKVVVGKSAEGALQEGQAKRVFLNQLDALKSMSVVVADTGEPALVKKFRPQDCTTNPSLVLKAVQSPEYSKFLAEALKGGGSVLSTKDRSRPYAGVADALTVNLGAEMLKVVPGRVSTEVDAHLSHDMMASYDKALHLVDLYAKRGVEPKRIYIKLASTWAGIEACRRLQKEGIDCNLTLLFSFAQAAACADAGAALISPFVGRIMDWYKAKEGREFMPHEDPGVLSTKRIYTYYKTHNYKTIVMAASFRNTGEIRELAGIDNITISPQLLAELEANTDPLPRKLDPCMKDDSSLVSMKTQAEFDALHNSDQMAVEKLAEGIKGFTVDQVKLELMLAEVAEKK
eukprot:CAMPEP_0119105050 /NCGR_PEP_ID=MMETSP1180-20130426/3106_1 /TAXON_ID=3052 ORGANISM="Chlamydomonas cf sp, Strain CCMP681" /NCGR_SAMPLE_ID=MMETSP1180 /ASSEMBLY_ACC=CAM_ASM_000741 /LENGTH=382 /DNA_ID=CAMNT_0007089985 /DNA_START=86 /DNA_END=1234 /DNA_ORIENTATION=-